jgi:trk system potassium uptake protein TrkA
VEHMPDHMHAKIFEADAKRCDRLNEIIDNDHTLVIHGDGRDLDVLIEEGIHTAQAFVAATDNSEANILACLAAKRMGVRKTVAMIENLDYVNMAESLDIGSILNKKTLAAGHIYRMMLKADVTTVKSLTVASADVAEFKVHEDSRITRKPIKDLSLPGTVTLGGLVRDGKGILINGMTQVKAGDTVVAFCLENAIKKIEKYFK